MHRHNLLFVPQKSCQSYLVRHTKLIPALKTSPRVCKMVGTNTDGPQLEADKATAKAENATSKTNMAKMKVDAAKMTAKLNSLGF